MEPERQDYKGHRIELRAPGASELRARRPGREAEPELLIDDEPVHHGQLPDGSYFLDQYAYDWRDDLMDLARAFIDYQNRAEEILRARDRGEEE